MSESSNNSSSSSSPTTSGEFTVVLEGGRPWGFTLQGGADFRSPLKIGKVTANGRAQSSGLLSGDIIVSINGVPATQMKHHEAQRLITSSKTTLELKCTKKSSVLFSPKSVTRGYTFDYPETTSREEKSLTLGNRHIRQKSLDLNYYRPRSTSDAGKRATIGNKIAGITVPPPPPRKTSQNSQSHEPGIPVSDVNATELKRDVPSMKSPENDNDCIPVLKSPEDDSPSIKSPDTDNLPDHENHQIATLDSSNSSLSNDITETVTIEKVDSTHNKEAEITTYKVELTNFHEVACDKTETQLATEISPNKLPDTKQLEEDSTSTKGDAGSTEVKDSSEILQSGKSDDWYKMMFQNMKKGVEDDLPNKKPVWDRSPVPARQTFHEFESKSSGYRYKNTSYVPQSPKRRFSESSVPSLTLPAVLPKPLKQSSSGSTIGSHQKADVVSGVSAGVVYQKNIKKYNQSRNYWKTIEKQASQERLELEAKRNSLRRSSSASSTGAIPQSPDALVTEEASKPKDQSPSFFQEEVVNVLSASIAEEDTKESSVSPVNNNETATMSKLHPLLKGDLDEEEKDSDLPQQDVFTRIDASKLNTALGNASVLGTMKQEGVDPLTIQAAALTLGNTPTDDPQKMVASEKKKKKPTSSKALPGKKAKVKFDFAAASEKELSLEKGAIIDLIEQVDDNWLKGQFQGNTGIFPVTYVKILSSEETLLLDMGSDPTEEPLLNLLARAMHDFPSQTAAELSLSKGDVVTVLKAKDENWYEVSMGDKSGIVPKSYVEIVDIDSDDVQ